MHGIIRVKYGNTSGKNQEREGPALALAFLEDSGLSEEAVGRIAYLVGHHHTPGAADGIDYQILIAAVPLSFYILYLILYVRTLIRQVIF